MGVDNKELKEFRKKLHKLTKEDRDVFLRSQLRGLAARHITLCVKNTQVVTGTLRRGWTGGVDENPMSYAKGLDVDKVGKAYKITISNPVEYASYYEYGHRARGGGGWVEGRFPMTKANDNIRKQSQAILEKALDKHIKEHMT